MDAVMSFRMKRWLADALFLAVLVCLMSWMGGCKNALGVGYRSVLVVRNAGDATSKALAAVAQAKREECKKKHAIKTIEYAACIRAHLVALETWRLAVKPSVNTALAAAFGVLEVARARKQKKAPWLEALKPGACALLVALRQWSACMPKDAESLLALLKGVEGLVCE